MRGGEQKHAAVARTPGTCAGDAVQRLAATVLSAARGMSAAARSRPRTLLVLGAWTCRSGLRRAGLSNGGGFATAVVGETTGAGRLLAVPRAERRKN